VRPADRVDTDWVRPADRVDTDSVTPANREDSFEVSSSHWQFLLGFGDKTLIAAYVRRFPRECPGTNWPALERCAIRVTFAES
jgi:hypothetical protein